MSRTLGVHSRQMLAALGYAYAVSGQKGDAQRVLDEMIESSKRGGVSPYQVAIIHTGLGNKDQAFQWLEKAYQEHSGWLSVLAVEPRFDSLRADPRFQDLASTESWINAVRLARRARVEKD